ncbi:hypothetical protein BJX70DRAFT_367575 [Aspergillus crustosus]
MPQTVHFQISEKHIKFAAQVFNRILKSKNHSKMVIMRGFDSEALLIVLNVIHAKFETVPRQVSLEILTRICAVAKYFECRDALRFASTCGFHMYAQACLLCGSRVILCYGFGCPASCALKKIGERQH